VTIALDPLGLERDRRRRDAIGPSVALLNEHPVESRRFVVFWRLDVVWRLTLFLLLAH
jgi:hypothetical protein